MQMHRKEVMTMYLNLKKEMDRNGVTIDDISKRLDLHRNTVSNKINGITPLSIEEGIIIKKILRRQRETGITARGAERQQTAA